MGRELADVAIGNKLIGANSRSFDKVHVAPRVANNRPDKEYEVKECTLENKFVEEECQEKQEVLGVKSINEKLEDQKSITDPKKLTTPDTKSGAVPNPFVLATEKRGTHHVGTESSPGGDNVNSPVKNSQIADYFQSGGAEPNDFAVGLHNEFQPLIGHDIGQFPGLESKDKTLMKLGDMS